MGFKFFNIFKKVKYWIDDNFREKVYPIPGSVLYCDLFGIVEHSGVYENYQNVINLEVNGFASAIVKRTNFSGFTDSSADSRIYVSCNNKGAVGSSSVSDKASSKIGDEDFYGLIFNNCHDFCIECLKEETPKNKLLNEIFDVQKLLGLATPFLPPIIQAAITGYKVFSSLDMEYSVIPLKKVAKNRIGATKWRLMSTPNNPKSTEPDISRDLQEYLNLSLNEENISLVKLQNYFLQQYLEEISDEHIPRDGINKIYTIKNTLERVEKNYEQVKDFSNKTGISFTSLELEKLNINELNKLMSEFMNNLKIKEIVDKLGREYISSEKESVFNGKYRINYNLSEEIYGIEKGNHLNRIIPSEISNLTCEELEVLFYAKYLENSLLVYELAGQEAQEEEKKENKKNKGPVVVNLDTSGSMNGERLIKAKALLLAIKKILSKEKRDLYILLFSGQNEILELVCDDSTKESDLLSFLNNGFGGGTDFETPLNRSFKIIQENTKFKKADILMVSDGDFTMSDKYSQYIKKMKSQLHFNIYTIITDNTIKKDTFSDEIINI